MTRQEKIEKLVKRQVNLVKLQEYQKTKRILKNIKSVMEEKKQGVLK